MNDQVLERIVEGRCDLIFEYVAAGHPATATDADGVSLLKWCAYFGDVSAIRFLLSNGESLDSLGEDLGLMNAVFHGHWQLSQFLIERGADANFADPKNGETPLHAVLCNSDRSVRDRVLRILLANGANPNCATKPNIETEGFMRDCRTKGETPLHRAAAFGTDETVQLMLAAGAQVDAKDMNGETPLSWGSWYARPDSILRKLCYGKFRIRPDREPMRESLLGHSLIEE